jgi:hypothetical protein
MNVETETGALSFFPSPLLFERLMLSGSGFFLTV